MEMDCSRTESGVFEFKAIVNGSKEGIIQNNQCAGAKPLPYDSDNHVATCGAVNVYQWNKGSCITIPMFL